MGCMLIILGSVPGLLHWIMGEVERLADSFSPSFRSLPSRRDVEYRKLSRPLGLAAAGAALILLSTLVYWWR
jgi:hypothetical protein